MNGVPEQWHLSKAIPVSLIVFLAAQTIALIVWAVKLDSRVSHLETSEITQNLRLSTYDAIQSKIAILEERQNNVLKRLDINASKLDAILGHMQIPIPIPR